MTPETIQQWAREVGADPREYGMNLNPGFAFYNMEILQRFAALARADLESKLLGAEQRAQLNGEIAAELKAERADLEAETLRLRSQADGREANIFHLNERVSILTENCLNITLERDEYQQAADKLAAENHDLRSQVAALRQAYGLMHGSSK